MGAKPAPDCRSPESDLEKRRRLSFKEKYLRFSFFSTPPPAVSKPDATQRSLESKPKTFFSPSLQKKDVLLFEWWLIKTKEVYNGRRLAVGGFTKSGETVETFTSAPIIKRHDDCTLETADGITLRLLGPINKTRTFDYGFPFEVSTIFLFGFPTTWDSSTAESSEDIPSDQPIMGLQPETTFEPSSLKKTVCLRNWWLRKTVKVEGSSLSVGGFDEFGKAMRIYNSSPITKRHDVYTLETADRITIRIQGFINKTRTLDNGFPLEACKAFLIGFPTTWTDFANNSSGEEPSHSETPVNASLSTERSSTIYREVIPEFVARGSILNTVHMPLVDNCSDHLPEKSICNNDRLQVDESCGTNMRNAETVDKGYEIPEADGTPMSNSCIEGFHSEASGCQTSEVDGLPQQKVMDDGKLGFIQDATLKNSKECSGHALTKGLHDEMVEICRTCVWSDSGIRKELDKEETAKKEDEKFYEYSTRRSERVRSRLSKLKNLHDEDQKFPKSSANPVRRTKRLMSPKVRNIQEDFQSYSQYLNKTNNFDSAKFAPSGSETSAISRPNETLVEGSPSSSNIYREDQKSGESSPKPVRNERIGLTTLGNVHGESQDYSQFRNDINNVNCSNIAPDGYKTSATSQPSGVLVEGSPSLPKLHEENQKFADFPAKPVRRSERLLLARLRNVLVKSHNYSQLLDDTYGTNCATLASKTSGTSLPNYAILTGSLSSPTGSIPVPSARCLLEEDQDGHQHSSNMSIGVASKFKLVSKYGSTLTPCLCQSLNEQRTTCDRIVSQVEGTPTNSKEFFSTLGKNIIPHGSKKKDNQTVRRRTMVDQIDSRYQRYFTTSEENISISSASNSRRKMKSVGVSTDMKKPTGLRIIGVSNYADVHRTPRNQYEVRNLSILTPESLSLKRSRSGRLLLPTLDCSTRVIYKADGSIAGTASVDGSIVGKA